MFVENSESLKNPSAPPRRPHEGRIFGTYGEGCRRGGRVSWSLCSSVTLYSNIPKVKPNYSILFIVGSFPAKRYSCIGPELKDYAKSLTLSDCRDSCVERPDCAAAVWRELRRGHCWTNRICKVGPTNGKGRPMVFQKKVIKGKCSIDLDNFVFNAM
jgi:hypothetical protein